MWHEVALFSYRETHDFALLFCAFVFLNPAQPQSCPNAQRILHTRKVWHFSHHKPRAYLCVFELFVKTSCTCSRCQLSAEFGRETKWPLLRWTHASFDGLWFFLGTRVVKVGKLQLKQKSLQEVRGRGICDARNAQLLFGTPHRELATTGAQKHWSTKRFERSLNSRRAKCATLLGIWNLLNLPPLQLCEVATENTGGATRCAWSCSPTCEKCVTLLDIQNMLWIWRARGCAGMQQKIHEPEFHKLMRFSPWKNAQLCFASKVHRELAAIVGAWGRIKNTTGQKVLQVVRFAMYEICNFIWHPTFVESTMDAARLQENTELQWGVRSSGIYLVRNVYSHLCDIRNLLKLLKRLMLRERKQNTQNREKSWNSRYEKCATLYWYQSCWRLHVTIVARGCHKNHRNCNNVREVVRSTTWKMHHFVLHSKSVLGSPRLWVCEDAAKHKSVKKCARSWDSGYVTCRTFVAFNIFLWMTTIVGAAVCNEKRHKKACKLCDLRQKGTTLIGI